MITKYICGDILKELINNEKFDLMITSPPYNIGKQYTCYNDCKTDEDYLNWMFKVYSKLYNHLSEDGSLYLNLGSNLKNAVLPVKTLLQATQAGFVLQNTIIWVKSIAIPDVETRDGIGFTGGHYTPIQSDRYHHSGFEYIFHLTKSGNVKINKANTAVSHKDKSNDNRWQNDSRDRGNVWYIPYDTVQDKRKHPAQFPFRLAEMCILDYGRIPNCILDPFCGVGTVGKVAAKYGYNSIGYDIDSSYIKIANEEL